MQYFGDKYGVLFLQNENGSDIILQYDMTAYNNVWATSFLNVFMDYVGDH